MRTYSITTAMGLGLLSLVITIPVAAVGPGQAVRQELRVEERAARVSSAPGLLRSFINKRATLPKTTLTSKTGTTLTVKGQDGKEYTVKTDTTTQLRRRFWGKATLDEMQINDTLNIIGKWLDEGKTQIQAVLIRDASIQKRNGVFLGTLKTVSGNTWTMDTQSRGTQTVTVSSITKFLNRKGEMITQSTVLVGHRVRVRGLWDNKANTITEVSEAKDFDLPVKLTTPTPISTQ